MFHRFSYGRDLYVAGRRLARFQAQNILRSLPAGRFLIKAAAEKSLPADSLRRYLETADTTEQTLAAFLSLYPELIGKENAETLRQAVDGLRNFADFTDDAACLRALNIFFSIAEKNPAIRPLAERFEDLLSPETDFRLEAAALEQLDDNFYEDDCLSALLPDWQNTTKDKLALKEQRDLFRLPSSPDKKRTAACLTSAVATMILRDGLVIAPSLAGCRVDWNGNLRFVRARMVARLDNDERRFISDFSRSLARRDYRGAAKAVMMSPYMVSSVSAPRLIRLIEEADIRSLFLPMGQKADVFLKFFADAGIYFSLNLRLCVTAMRQADTLCYGVLQINGDIWVPAKQVFSDFSAKGSMLPPLSDEDELKHVFGLEESQTEQLSYQRKKLPVFQSDVKKIPEILRRNSFAGRFRAHAFPYARSFLALIIAGAALSILLKLF